MATYYRWRKSTISYSANPSTTYNPGDRFAHYSTFSKIYYSKSYSIVNGSFQLNSPTIINGPDNSIYIPPSSYFMWESATSSVMYYAKPSGYNLILDWQAEGYFIIRSGGVSTSAITYTVLTSSGTFQEYVYSTSASTYPNGGVSGSYYYDQRTTITSPTAPSELTHPSPIVTTSVPISWTAATSNIDSYPVSQYEVSYSTNGGSSWTVAGTTASNSYTFQVTPGTTSIQFRVRAKDSNGQWGEYLTGAETQVLLSPDLTVPEMVMQGQSIPVLWSAITGADSYTLQRKADADEDWVDVYSGANTSFSETAGTWSSVQYRVKAIFGETPGEWATSASIPVISATALVISGQNGDLGTLVNDVPYTISTDTGNQISVKTTVNGAVILNGTLPSGTAERIPVLDLVHGDGTIVIEASVETDGGTVSATRIWTYTKAAITFPSAGSVAQLEKNGGAIWPKTLAECVRLPGGRTLEEVMGFPAQIYVERYTGTGTYGSGDPNEITIPFKPQAVFVSSGSDGTTIPMIRPGTKAMNGSAELTVAWEDDGVSWYSASAANQLNAAGTTYDVVAFG